MPVNTRRESRRREAEQAFAIIDSDDGCALPVQPAVHLRVPHHRLHVIARFGEWDRLDELGRLAIRNPPRQPLRQPVRPGIVRGERLRNVLAVRVQHGFQDRRADLQAHGRIVQLLRRELRDSGPLRHAAGGRGLHLREAAGIGARARLRVELRFLADQPGQQEGIEVLGPCAGLQVAAPRQRIQHLPEAPRGILERADQVVAGGGLHGAQRLIRGLGLLRHFHAEQRGLPIGADAEPQLVMEMAEQAEAPYQALRAMKATAGDYLIRPLEDAPRRFWEMLYPLPWRGDLEAGARAQNLDPFLLAGLIRQESEFNPEARSRADARGLTQVQPATARGVAQRAGVPQFTPEQLYDPAVSLKIGAAVLKSMLDAHGENVPQTLAAYNAGPNRLAQWLAWGIPYREPAEFIESIPFTETRDYVQAVMRNAEMYRRLYR